jgi:hypothetical protein
MEDEPSNKEGRCFPFVAWQTKYFSFDRTTKPARFLGIVAQKMKITMKIPR